MRVDPVVLATILGMAMVTYATRIGGFLLLGRLNVTARVAAWLHYVPGAVVVSIIVPSVLPIGLVGGDKGASGALTGSPAEALAAVVVLLVAARTKSLLVAIASGVLAVWLLRQLFGV